MAKIVLSNAQFIFCTNILPCIEITEPALGSMVPAIRFKVR